MGNKAVLPKTAPSASRVDSVQAAALAEAQAEMLRKSGPEEEPGLGRHPVQLVQEFCQKKNRQLRVEPGEKMEMEGLVSFIK